MFHAQILLVSILFASAYGANDWTVPCTSGQCSYDAGDGINTAWSSINLSGPTTSLTDITVAAGWQISGCSPTWASGLANASITCTGTSEQIARCAHLFEGGSAVDKIVRLPQDCGIGPFARVVGSTPLQRRDIDLESHALTLDYNFDHISSTSRGAVFFELSASNIRSDVVSHTRRRRAYPIAPRFDVSKNFDLPPFKVQQTFPLFNQSANCPTGTQGVKIATQLSVDADVDVDAQVSFGLSVSGQIFPPDISKFQVTSKLNGAAGADFDIVAGLQGGFDSGLIPLFKAGLPGLDFPGILSIGPQFVVNTRVTSELDIQANVKTGVHFMFPAVQLVFPQDEGDSGATTHPTVSPVKLTLDGNASGNASLVGHIIPRVELGLSLLSFANADVFLELDASGKLGLQVDASASIDGPASASGCAQLDAGIDIRAGAEGAIAGIFNKSANFDIFKKDFNLFKKCFGTTPSPSPSPKITPAAMPSHHTKRELLCPSFLSSNLRVRDELRIL